MGLGKTVTTLTAVNTLLFEELAIRKVLIIAPKRVAEFVWTAEVHKWAHLSKFKVCHITGTPSKRLALLDTQAHIYTISKELVTWLFNQKNFPEYGFDMLVVDELSAFKSSRAIRFRTLKKHRKLFSRIVGLTGTPHANGLEDLWAQMFIIDGGASLFPTITQYRNRFFTKGYFKYTPKKDAAKEVYALLQSTCLAMKAKDYLDLPSLIVNDVVTPMPEEVNKKYDTLLKERILELEASDEPITATTAAVVVNKLQQLASGFLYDEERAATWLHDTKIRVIKELLEAVPEENVIICYKYTAERERLLEHLVKYEPKQLLTASDIENWNEGKIKVLLTNPVSVGHGLNLQKGGRRIIWFSLTYSHEVYSQMNARLHRQGQTSKVLIHRLITKGTVDESVSKSLGRKESSHTLLMNTLKSNMLKKC